MKSRRSAPASDPFVGASVSGDAQGNVTYSFPDNKDPTAGVAPGDMTPEQVKAHNEWLKSNSAIDTSKPDTLKMLYIVLALLASFFGIRLFTGQGRPQRGLGGFF